MKNLIIFLVLMRIFLCNYEIPKSNIKFIEIKKKDTKK